MKQLKRFFETPKRAAISIGCIALALFFLGIGTAFGTSLLIRQHRAVTLDQAIAAALADAGIAGSEDVTVTKAGRDMEQGISLYDIEFCVGDTKYEYEIYEETGAVYSKSKETVLVQMNGQSADSPVGSGVSQDTGTQAGIGQSGQKAEQQDSDTQQPGSGQSDTALGQSDTTGGQETQGQSDGGQNTGAQQSDVQQTPGQPQNVGQIELNSAKEIAVSDAGLIVSDVTFTKAELEYEDGIAVFEIEFHTRTHEYEYEIYASDGTICSKDKEALDGVSGNSETHPGSDIGIEQAKAIALNHAGYSAADVHFSKAKFEEEHGVLIYEIEFYMDGMEYEYEIDASTGEILKFDSDYDD